MYPCIHMHSSVHIHFVLFSQSLCSSSTYILKCMLHPSIELDICSSYRSVRSCTRDQGADRRLPSKHPTHTGSEKPWYEKQTLGNSMYNCIILSALNLDLGLNLKTLYPQCVFGVFWFMKTYRSTSA